MNQASAVAKLSPCSGFQLTVYQKHAIPGLNVTVNFFVKVISVYYHITLHSACETSKN